MLVSTLTNNKLRIETMISSNDDDDDDGDFWEDIKSFFTPQNSMIILAIICFIFFLITLCLVIIIFQLLKKKRLYQNQIKTTMSNYPKLDHHINFPALPMQTGLTSNQIPLSNTNESLPLPTIIASTTTTTSPESTKTQSFETFENELKRTSNNNNDDEIETVNEVLGMEERNGKVYYKVNFTGHPSDYTAWVCEEDLIPE